MPFTCFSLFLGVSMSVTAFPVLARILTDRGIHKTRMGAIALTCAAVDDVTAWCMLAFVVSVARAQATGAVATIAMALGFIALMILVIRPAMVRLSLLYGNRGRLTQGVMASIFIALLISASATELIGIHAVFGAFALGAVIPHDSGMARELTDRLEDIVIVLLLPAFFAYTGLRTQIGLVSGYEQWMMCALIILVASAGKFGGSADRGAAHGARLARLVGARRADEHARPDGTDRAEHRAGDERHLADAVRDAGDHGADHDFCDDADSASDHAQAASGCSAVPGSRNIFARARRCTASCGPRRAIPHAASRATHQSAVNAAAVASDAGRNRAQRHPGARVESGGRCRSDRTRARGDAARRAAAARACTRENAVGRSAIGIARGRPTGAAPLSRAVGRPGPGARARQHHHAAGSLDDQSRGGHPVVRQASHKSDGC